MARAMKDSGIEWIGEIPEGWKVSKVSTFFDIQLGKMLQPSQENESETYESYLCAANLGNNKLKMEPLKQMWFSREDKEKFSVRCGDLLVVEGGDVASSDIIAEPVHGLYIQNALHRVRSRNGFELRFLRYYLSIAKASGHIDLICNKATIAHFTKDKFGALPYVVVPLEEQKRIADYLDSECARIDAVIEQTRASIEEYKKLKQSIITQAVTKGIRPGRKMKDSGIEWVGEIPEEWVHATINKFCSLKTGGTPSTANSEWFDGDLNWFTPGDFSEQYTLSGSARKLSFKAKADGVAVIFPKDTVMIVGIGGTAGKIGLTTCECSCNQQVTAIITNQKIKSRFLMYWMIANTKRLKDTALYTTLPIINNQTIGEYPVLVPNDIDEQNEIICFLDEESKEIENLIKKKHELIEALESYKKSLIFEYVTGKKEVV